MLNNAQQKQINMQLENHKHKDYIVDIKLTDDEILKKFLIKENVFRSDIMSAMYLAKYLYFNNGIYKNKKVLDLGCGAGIQGITAAKYGAKSVFLSDISEFAVENTKKNVLNYNITKICDVYQSDLFENITGKFDIVIFNHPFFPGDAIKNNVVSESMLGGTKLIHRFFKDVKKYLSKDGIIIMPYFSLAGKFNDPKIQGKKYGFKVIERFNKKSDFGLQKGQIYIYELVIK